MRTVGYLNRTVRRDKEEGEYKIETDEEKLERVTNHLVLLKRVMNIL